MELKAETHNKKETVDLALLLSSFLEVGDVITLEGDLGAGKTTFVGGIAKGLGIKEEVISPTFNIMKCYFDGRLPLYHIDAYRLEGQNIELGLDEAIEGDGVAFIEWPMFIDPIIPEERLKVEIRNLGGDSRSIAFISTSSRFDNVLTKMKEQL